MSDMFTGRINPIAASGLYTRLRVNRRSPREVIVNFGNEQELSQ